MNMKKIITLAGFFMMGCVIACLFFLKQVGGSRELVRGRVSDVNKNADLARVVYDDPKSGSKKQLDIAILPGPNALPEIKAREQGK